MLKNASVTNVDNAPEYRLLGIAFDRSANQLRRKKTLDDPSMK